MDKWLLDKADANCPKLFEREITTDRLGEMVMERIKPMDEVAYIRFASVYKDFREVKDFEEFVSKINS